MSKEQYFYEQYLTNIASFETSVIAMKATDKPVVAAALRELKALKAREQEDGVVYPDPSTVLEIIDRHCKILADQGGFMSKAELENSVGKLLEDVKVRLQVHLSSYENMQRMITMAVESAVKKALEEANEAKEKAVREASDKAAVDARVPLNKEIADLTEANKALNDKLKAKKEGYQEKLAVKDEEIQALRAQLDDVKAKLQESKVEQAGLAGSNQTHESYRQSLAGNFERMSLAFNRLSTAGGIKSLEGGDSRNSMFATAPEGKHDAEASAAEQKQKLESFFSTDKFKLIDYLVKTACKTGPDQNAALAILGLVISHPFTNPSQIEGFNPDVEGSKVFQLKVKKLAKLSEDEQANKQRAEAIVEKGLKGANPDKPLEAYVIGLMTKLAGDKGHYLPKSLAKVLLDRYQGLREQAPDFGNAAANIDAPGMVNK